MWCSTLINPGPLLLPHLLFDISSETPSNRYLQKINLLAKSSSRFDQSQFVPISWIRLPSNAASFPATFIQNGCSVS